MANKNDAAKAKWEEMVAEWWDDNQLQDEVENPSGEAMYDAFAFIQELITIREGDS